MLFVCALARTAAFREAIGPAGLPLPYIGGDIRTVGAHRSIVCAATLRA
jgi:hypothetical protein